MIGTAQVRWMIGLAALCVWLACAGLAHSAQHRFRLHRQPDLTIKAMAEDGPRMWLAADQGLYTFNGFQFEREGSYPFKAAHDLAMTGDGSLWIVSRSGLVRRRPQGTFEVVLRGDASSLASPGDRVFVQMETLLEVDLQGRQTKWTESARGALLADASGDIHFVDGSFAWRRIRKGSRAAETGRVVGDYEVALPDGNGRLWVAHESIATSVEPPPRSLRRSSLGRVWRKTPLLPGRDGTVWFLGDRIENLSRETVFRGSQAQDGSPPTAALEDSAGHLWVARRGLGLIEWIPDDSLERWYPEDFLQDTPRQVLPGSSPLLVARNGLYRLARGVWTHIEGSPQGLYAALALPNGEYMATLFTGELVMLTAQGNIKQVIARRTSADSFVELILDAFDQAWVSSSATGWHRVTRQGLRWILEAAEQPVPPGSYNSFHLDRDGVLRIAHANGISALSKDGRWEPIRTERPLPPARFVSAVSANRLWMAGADHKLYRVDRQTSGLWTFTKVDCPVVNFGFLKVDSRGWVWAGSSVGVHLMDGDRAGPGDWLHLTARNGLPGEDMSRHSFSEAPDGSIWLAASEGVVRLRPDPGWFRLGRTRAADLSRGHAGSISIASLQSSPLHDFPYLFRFRPGPDAWVGSRDGRIEAEDIPKGSRRVEVRMSGSQTIAAMDLEDLAPRVAQRWWWLAALPLSWPLWRSLRRLTFVRKVLYYARKQAYLWRLGSASAQPSSDVSILCAGDVVHGRYRIERQISRGGFSRVFEGLELETGRRVALKILPAVSSDGARVSRDAFLKEVAALRSIDHRGIVRILDSWVGESGEPCLAMELLQGPTLRAELEKGPLDAARCARVVEQMGESLTAIHSRGLVHRDLKPENIILVSRSGKEEPVLIDFGAAGLAAAAGELAASTLLAGSFHYLAPERLSGHYSPASDVYSLGMVILEMLTQRRLSDVDCVPAEERFVQALDECLKPALGNTAQAFAEALALAFDPVPRRRPGAADAWTRQLAGILAQSVAPISDAIH